MLEAVLTQGLVWKGPQGGMATRPSELQELPLVSVYDQDLAFLLSTPPLNELGTAHPELSSAQVHQRLLTRAAGWAHRPPPLIGSAGASVGADSRHVQSSSQLQTWRQAAWYTQVSSQECPAKGSAAQNTGLWPGASLGSLLCVAKPETPACGIATQQSHGRRTWPRGAGYTDLCVIPCLTTNGH